MSITEQILQNKNFTKENIISLLQLGKTEAKLLFAESLKTKRESIGLDVHLRGLIEYSNICEKNCLYCGLRKSNEKKNTYTLSDNQIDFCIQEAIRLQYGSVALQCGEQSGKEFTEKITQIIKKIKQVSENKIGITLSCGEQSKETYREWFNAGAHRYLLRIETSNEDLYYKIHPKNSTHSFYNRVKCLEDLKDLGYQVGTGVMVGLPFQSTEDLADDILFFKQKDVAMIGLGPFIPHQDTPLWQFRENIPDKQERMFLTLKMIAILRLVMPEINMVSATANQTLDPLGREKAIVAGANIIMPNLTPTSKREDYAIYPDKACVKDSPDDCANCLEIRMRGIEHNIVYNEWGDSLAFIKKHTAFKS